MLPLRSILLKRLVNRPTGRRPGTMMGHMTDIVVSSRTMSSIDSVFSLRSRRKQSTTLPKCVCGEGAMLTACGKPASMQTGWAPQRSPGKFSGIKFVFVGTLESDFAGRMLDVIQSGGTVVPEPEEADIAVIGDRSKELTRELANSGVVTIDEIEFLKMRVDGVPQHLRKRLETAKRGAGEDEVGRKRARRS
jgi:hypothetical protein